MLSNPGNSPLTVARISVTGAFAETDNCVGVVAPLANCAINVTFTPTARGANTGQLTIASNAANSPSVVALTGKGISALIALSQYDLYFYDELVGITSSPQPIVISNPGELALALTNISITGNFAQTNNCSGGVAPGASCTVNVTFTPNAAGQLSGALQFVDNAPGQPPTVRLLGNGSINYSTPFIYSLSPVASAAGSEALTLTVNGIYFGPKSTVYWNGNARTTTFVNGGQLTAAILASDLTTVGTPLVTVTNPAPGGTSTGVGFDVIQPMPSLTFLRKDVPVGNGPTAVAAGDFNGDGKTDLAVTNYTDNTVSILLGNGDGTFQPAVTYPTGANGSLAIAAGDFNHDGNLDLAVAANGCVTCSSGSIVVLLGNGDGTFQAPITTISYDSIDTLAVGDFNGDGKLDLAVGAWSNGGQVDIFLGNGDGTFTAGGVYPTGVENSQAPDIAVGDFNGDGKLDLATANGYSSNNVSILLGNGDGTFQPQVQYPAGLAAWGIIAADLNGDGKLDVAVANSDPSANTVSVLLGKGDGTLASHVDYPTGVGPIRLASGDFNGDGKVDLAVADEYSNTVSILFGNGDGTFQAKQDFAVGNGPGGIVAKDFSGGGVADIAVTNYGSNSVSILLQISLGSVAPATLSFGNQGVGTTSSSQSATLSNTGSAPLLIGAVAASGDFGVASGGTCSTSTPLVGGATCTINVTFTPTAIGSRTGTLTVTDNSNGVATSTQTVNLSGTGTPAPLVITASSASMTYGGTAPAITPSYSGFVNGDTPASLTTVPTCSTTATSSTPVGTDTGADICSGAVDSNYSITYVAGNMTVNQAATVISWATPAPISYGTALSSTQLNATASAPGTFVYSPAAGTTPVAGTATLSVTFMPTDTTDYTAATQTVSLTVSKATPTITWAKPAAITFGATLGSTQLDATASVPGTFVYSPAAGTTLAAGTDTLSVTFTPTDFADYNTATATVSLAVEDFSFAPPSGAPTSTSVAPGSPATYTLSVGGKGGLSGTVTFTCTGAPSEATCTVSPNPATAGNSPTNVTVTVTTTAASVSAPRSRPLPPIPPLSPGLRGLLLLALVLAMMAWAIRQRNRAGVGRWQSRMVLLASGLLLALTLAGCGGGGSGSGGGPPPNPGTPAGTYTLTVTGSAGSGSAIVSHSVALTLTVS